MSKIQTFRRELKYNAMVFQLLAEREIPYLVYYGPDGRSIEAKSPIPSISIIFKTAPMPEGKVLLVVKPTGMKMFVEELPEILLRQKLLKYIGKLLS